MNVCAGLINKTRCLSGEVMEEADRNKVRKSNPKIGGGRVEHQGG